MTHARLPRPTAVLAAAATAALLVVAPVAGGPADAAGARTYKNCDAMHRDHPHGVGRPGARDKTSGTPVRNFTVSRALYNANTKSDRDKDGIACEAS